MVVLEGDMAGLVEVMIGMVVVVVVEMVEVVIGMVEVLMVERMEVVGEHQ